MLRTAIFIIFTAINTIGVEMDDDISYLINR